MIKNNARRLLDMLAEVPASATLRQTRDVEFLTLNLGNIRIKRTVGAREPCPSYKFGILKIP